MSTHTRACKHTHTHTEKHVHIPAYIHIHRQVVKDVRVPAHTLMLMHTHR